MKCSFWFWFSLLSVLMQRRQQTKHFLFCSYCVCWANSPSSTSCTDTSKQVMNFSSWDYNFPWTCVTLALAIFPSFAAQSCLHPFGQYCKSDWVGNLQNKVVSGTGTVKGRYWFWQSILHEYKRGDLRYITVSSNMTIFPWKKIKIPTTSSTILQSSVSWFKPKL